MAWDEGQTLTTRFEHACQAAGDLHPHWTLGTSYAGFTAALVPWTTPLAEAIKRRFPRQMQGRAGAFGQRGRGTAVTADGTRLKSPLPWPPRPIEAVPATRRPRPRSS